jgi:hypothetical protein
MGSLLHRAISGSLSMEEVADGKPNKEVEHVLYARIVNFEDLKKADSMEHQEQWEIKLPKSEKNGAGGKIRVRKTVHNGTSEPEYVITTKLNIGQEGDVIEVPVPTTVAMFDSFKYLSEFGMKKDRYCFKVEGTDLVWEVDAFIKPEGGYWEYCKIDLEVKDRSDAMPPLPIDFRDVIVGKSEHLTEAEQMKIRSLYENEFLTKNEHL